MIDDSESDFLDGLLFGWVMFDNNKNPLGFIITVVIIISIVLYFYYN